MPAPKTRAWSVWLSISNGASSGLKVVIADLVESPGTHECHVDSTGRDRADGPNLHVGVATRPFAVQREADRPVAGGADRLRPRTDLCRWCVQGVGHSQRATEEASPNLQPGPVRRHPPTMTAMTAISATPRLLGRICMAHLAVQHVRGFGCCWSRRCRSAPGSRPGLASASRQFGPCRSRRGRRRGSRGLACGHVAPLTPTVRVRQAAAIRVGTGA